MSKKLVCMFFTKLLQHIGIEHRQLCHVISLTRVRTKCNIVRQIYRHIQRCSFKILLILITPYTEPNEPFFKRNGPAISMSNHPRSVIQGPQWTFLQEKRAELKHTAVIKTYLVTYLPKYDNYRRHFGGHLEGFACAMNWSAMWVEYLRLQMHILLPPAWLCIR